MDNNLALTRYIQDEYLSPIVAGHKVNQQERQNLTKEFLSALKNANKHDNNVSWQKSFFLVAVAQKLLGVF